MHANQATDCNVARPIRPCQSPVDRLGVGTATGLYDNRVVTAIAMPVRMGELTEDEMRVSICTALFVVFAADSAFAQIKLQEQTNRGAEQVLLAADKAWEVLFDTFNSDRPLTTK